MNKQDVNEYISGIIERITYHNLDNGFCVLRIKVKGHRDLITVTGNIPYALIGEYIKCSGIWYNDRNHGKQFKAHFIKSLPPDTLEGIEKYLGSGLIQGIGPYFAKKLILAFKDRVLEVIEHEPHLLSTVDGIGKVRANRICKNWQEQKVIHEIMVFLQSHGVGTTRATRIYKTYGDRAIEIVLNNPYQLAKDIRGIGFISADTIARNLGIDQNSLIRAKAGVTHALLETTSDGHCGLPKKILLQNIQKLLDIAQEIVEQAIIEEVESNTLIIDTINDVESIFLTSYYIYEKNIAKILVHLTKTAVTWDEVDTASVLPSIEQDLGGITLATSQKKAINQAVQHKLMVITGGPGTGKTTLVNSLLKVLLTKKLNIKLCAPTGRAAKRLSESTGLEATTIHRLLEIDPANGGFKRNEESPLLCDYLVIDEASMVDISLFYALLKALPPHSALLIVGDVDQLPSVGAGQVLKDIINSRVIPTVKLTEIFRQAATSNIIINAHKVNNGILPDLTPKKKESDFYFIEAEHGEDIINKIIIMIKDRIPNKFNFNPINDIQLLCPMQRGGVGARSLNIELQKILNPHYSNGITKFGHIFAIGDKVMQTENNYDKEVYNGDIGVINNINEQDQEIRINFYNRDVIYDYNDLDQITLAYATTIHKSQGSEYPAVIIPLTMQSYMMLKRNLIYTAITRGKHLVIIIGQRRALAIAIQDNKTSVRYSKLKEWLIAY